MVCGMISVTLNELIWSFYDYLYGYDSNPKKKKPKWLPLKNYKTELLKK